ncbi:hypothetical protein GCM10009528_23380 [Kineococcus aurantiacus]
MYQLMRCDGHEPNVPDGGLPALLVRPATRRKGATAVGPSDIFSGCVVGKPARLSPISAANPDVHVIKTLKGSSPA